MGSTVEKFDGYIENFKRSVYGATLVVLVNPSIGIIGIYLISFIILLSISDRKVRNECKAGNR